MIPLFSEKIGVENPSRFIAYSQSFLRDVLHFGGYFLADRFSRLCCN